MQLTGLPEVSTPLPWHEQEWALLNQQMDQGQLPHALMLVGRQHTGKSQLALALARRLLCASAEGSLNCGKCHACELSATGGHGDFRWVAPTEKSRVIKIDQVRDVVRFSNKTAGFGVAKVIVLAPAESMNVAAFNALLKSLEEPSHDTYLILVCDHMYGVPATIRSRCHILRLATPDRETSLSWLDQTTGQRERSAQLLALSDGLPLLAKSLYSAGDTEELAARRVSLEALINNRITVHQACSLWGDLETGELLEGLTGDLQRILRALPPAQLRARPGRTLFELMDEVARLRLAVGAGSNPSKALLVEALFAKIHRSLGGAALGDSIQARSGDSGT